MSKENTFAMLAEIGGECASAVTFLPDGETLTSGNPKYKSLSESELAINLSNLPKRPMMAGEEGIHLSLAGAQDKITAHYDDNQFPIPLNGTPSTHILKPAIEEYEDTVMNEAVCMKLANDVGFAKSALLKPAPIIADKILTALPEVERGIPEGNNVIKFIREFVAAKRTRFVWPIVSRYSLVYLASS